MKKVSRFLDNYKLEPFYPSSVNFFLNSIGIWKSLKIKLLLYNQINDIGEHPHVKIKSFIFNIF